jgi:hypothetical protein
MQTRVPERAGQLPFTGNALVSVDHPWSLHVTDSGTVGQCPEHPRRRSGRQAHRRLPQSRGSRSRWIPPAPTTVDTVAVAEFGWCCLPSGDSRCAPGGCAVGPYVLGSPGRPRGRPGVLCCRPCERLPCLCPLPLPWRDWGRGAPRACAPALTEPFRRRVVRPLVCVGRALAGRQKSRGQQELRPSTRIGSALVSARACRDHGAIDDGGFVRPRIAGRSGRVRSRRRRSRLGCDLAGRA